MSSPIPEISASLVPFGFLAVIMVAANLYLLTLAFPRRGGTPHFGTVVVVVGVWFMTSILWLALVYAVLSPGDASTVSVFIAGNSMMGVFGAWLIAVFYRAEEKRLPRYGWFWPAFFSLLIVGAELLMGVAFVLALAGPGGYATTGWVGFGSLVRDAVGSVWFSWAMLANMALLLAWLPLPRPERLQLAGLAASAALGPWVVRGDAPALAAMGGLMVGVLGLAMWTGSRETPPTVSYVRTAAGVAGAYAAMTVAGLAGVLAPSAFGGTLPFAVTTTVVMAGELIYLGRWALGRPPPPTASPAPTGDLHGAPASAPARA
jgi:hypothetical protein